MNTYRILCCLRCQYASASNDPSEDLKKVFEKYSSKNGMMGLEQLQEFMKEVQGEENASEVAQAVLDKSKDFRLFKKKDFSLDAFFRYLSSNDNSPLPSVVSLEISSIIFSIRHVLRELIKTIFL